MRVAMSHDETYYIVRLELLSIVGRLIQYNMESSVILNVSQHAHYDRNNNNNKKLAVLEFRISLFECGHNKLKTNNNNI